MILNNLDVESGTEIIKLGYDLHQESKYRATPYNEDRCWAVLNATQNNDKFFIAYDDKFRGFLILQATAHYFSGELWTADLAFYVAPEFRGTSLGVKLLKAGEEWSKKIGATEMTIFHNTGIRIDKSESFFNRIGYTTAGYIFTKDLICAE